MSSKRVSLVKILRLTANYLEQSIRDVYNFELVRIGTQFFRLMSHFLFCYNDPNNLF
jgi:hypothetical protein